MRQQMHLEEGRLVHKAVKTGGETLFQKFVKYVKVKKLTQKDVYLQWQRNAAHDTFRDMEKMKTLPLKREALRKATYHNEMDFTLWKVQWEEVVCNCNKFNKVQALMIGHRQHSAVISMLVGKSRWVAAKI